MELLEFEMDGQEAEGHFGTGIYDLCPGPESGELHGMVRIPGWDSGRCSKARVESTGSIGALKIEDMTFDQAGEGLELKFRVL